VMAPFLNWIGRKVKSEELDEYERKEKRFK
jgi:hypothetical protein